jgi:hypothetical protein
MVNHRQVWMGVMGLDTRTGFVDQIRFPRLEHEEVEFYATRINW